MINTKIEWKYGTNFGKEQGTLEKMLRNHLVHLLTSNRGTTYIEYFLTAVAMAVATMVLWNGLGSIRDNLKGQADTRMSQIAGGVGVP